jgi:hypothetical protein
VSGTGSSSVARESSNKKKKNRTIAAMRDDAASRRQRFRARKTIYTNKRCELHAFDANRLGETDASTSLDALLFVGPSTKKKKKKSDIRQADAARHALASRIDERRTRDNHTRVESTRIDDALRLSFVDDIERRSNSALFCRATKPQARATQHDFWPHEHRHADVARQPTTLVRQNRTKSKPTTPINSDANERRSASMQSTTLDNKNRRLNTKFWQTNTFYNARTRCNDNNMRLSHAHTHTENHIEAHLYFLILWHYVS